LSNLNAGKNINRAWENIKENIKTSAKESLRLHEFKQHKPCFDKIKFTILRSEKAE
jgi:hypothetical protein